MNTMDTFHQMDKSHQGYITEFNDKSEFEQRINTAWRRDEPEAVEELLQAAAVSDDLDHKIYDLAFNLANNLRERKTSSGKAYCSRVITRILSFFTRRRGAHVSC